MLGPLAPCIKQISERAVLLNVLAHEARYNMAFADCRCIPAVLALHGELLFRNCCKFRERLGQSLRVDSSFLLNKDRLPTSTCLRPIRTERRIEFFASNLKCPLWVKAALLIARALIGSDNTADQAVLVPKRGGSPPGLSRTSLSTSSSNLDARLHHRDEKLQLLLNERNKHLRFVTTVVLENVRLQFLEVTSVYSSTLLQIEDRANLLKQL